MPALSVVEDGCYLPTTTTTTVVPAAEAGAIALVDIAATVIATMVINFFISLPS
jgi:hypothetical protein